MGLGGEVDHDVVVPGHRPDQCGVADVSADEREPRVARNHPQVGQVAGVGKPVEHGHPGVGELGIPTRDQGTDVMRADEPGSPGYQDSHELICTLL